MVQAQINLAKYPPETAKILYRDIFWFFLKDEGFVSKTINEGSVDLDKFPASRACQLAKKMESSKATARHIKQVAGDPQVAQINLMCHQCTELPNGKYKKNHKPSRSKHIIKMENKDLQSNTRRALILDWLTKIRIDAASAEIQLILKGSCAQPKSISAKHATSLATTQAFASIKTQQKQSNYKQRKPTVHQLTAGTIHAHDSNKEADSSDDSFCLQLKFQHVQAHHKQTHKPACFITNLAYMLKQHENRNLYLRLRLDTCADVNIMPAYVYKLVYRDPNLEKLAPNKMHIGTCTNDTVKIVGTCKLYLVHPDTKKLKETIFYVATNDGSMLLSCNTTLDLDLIQPRSRLDYLPPRASLITSTQDHPNKTRQAQPYVHRS